METREEYGVSGKTYYHILQSQQTVISAAAATD